MYCTKGPQRRKEIGAFCYGDRCSSQGPPLQSRSEDILGFSLKSFTATLAYQ